MDTWIDRPTDRQIQINVIKMRDKGKNVSAAKDALEQHEGGWNQLARAVHAAGAPGIPGRPRTLIWSLQDSQGKEIVQNGHHCAEDSAQMQKDNII